MKKKSESRTLQRNFSGERAKSQKSLMRCAKTFSRADGKTFVTEPGATAQKLLEEPEKFHHLGSVKYFLEFLERNASGQCP